MLEAAETVHGLITYQEAAEALNISKRTVRRLIDSGKIPIVRSSVRSPRIRLTDLEAYMSSNTVVYSAPAMV